MIIKRYAMLISTTVTCINHVMHVDQNKYQRCKLKNWDSSVCLGYPVDLLCRASIALVAIFISDLYTCINHVIPINWFSATRAWINNCNGSHPNKLMLEIGLHIFLCLLPFTQCGALPLLKLMNCSWTFWHDAHILSITPLYCVIYNA